MKINVSLNRTDIIKYKNARMIALNMSLKLCKLCKEHELRKMAKRKKIVPFFTTLNGIIKTYRFYNGLIGSTQTQCLPDHRFCHNYAYIPHGMNKIQ